MNTASVLTFLIGDVRDYTRFTLERGDEAAAELTGRFAELAEQVVRAHDGRVVELRGDEVLAAFSSARRALHAAVELQARLARVAADTLPLAVGIGLDAGEAVPVDGGYRGAALNLAARLCSVAGPGEVLATETVINLARKTEGLEYTERGMYSLKGFTEQVRVMEVRSVSMRETSHEATEQTTTKPGLVRQDLPIGGYLGSLPGGSLVARHAEVETLRATVDAVLNGSGKLLLLSGEAGAGKTRLAQEATMIAFERGLMVVAGRCYEPQQAVPFYPFLDVLSAAHAGSPPAVRSTILKHWPGVAQLLPTLGLPHQDYAAPQDQQRLFWAVTGFFQALSQESPLAILLDDLHWADVASIDLLQHLAHHTGTDRIFLLGTYRDVEIGGRHPLSAMLRDLERDSIVERVPVRRLEPEGTAALIAATMGSDSASPGLATLVHARTDGNPFFVQQVTRMLVERGDILREDGRWDRPAAEGIQVPDTVRSVISQRLSHLSDTTQEVLHEASALGQAFRFDDLQEMAARSESELDSALEEAMTMGLVREAGRDEYGFDHALTQQALYSQLSSRRRRKLHLAAGGAIERLLGDRRDRRAAELAWHFINADVPERALPYSIRAGDQAEVVFAHDDAARHFETALEVAQQLGDSTAEAAVRERLGGLLTAVIRYDEALPMLEQAAKMYRAAGDREAEARVVAQIGRVHVAGGSVEQGIERLQETLASTGVERSPSALAALNSSLARLLYVGTRYRDALEAAERATHHAGEGAGGVLAEAEVTRGASLTMLGEWAEGLEVLEAAVSRAEEVDDVFSACRGLQHISGVYLARGEVARSRDAMNRALSLAERMGNRRQLATALFGLSLSAFLTGDPDEAADKAERARMLMRELGGYWLRVLHTAALSLALSTEQWAIAPDALKECVVASEKPGELFRLRDQRMLAEQDLQQDKPQAALARLQALLEDPALHAEQTAGLAPLVAVAYHACGDDARAQAEVERSLQHVSMHGLRMLQPGLMTAYGLILAGQEDLDSAAAHCRKAADLAADLSYPYAEARALFDLAMIRVRAGDPAQGRRLLDEAQTLFQRVGALAQVEQSQKALAQLD